MELKVTVDLDDFEIRDYYGEGNLTLSEIIKEDIIRETVSKIKELILDKYYDKIQEATEKKISEMTEKCYMRYSSFTNYRTSSLLSKRTSK